MYLPGFAVKMNLLELAKETAPFTVTFVALAGDDIIPVKSVQDVLSNDPCTFKVFAVAENICVPEVF